MPLPIVAFAVPAAVLALFYANRFRLRRREEVRLMSGGRKSFVLNMFDR